MARILLGVSGGIAAYRALDVVRLARPLNRFLLELRINEGPLGEERATEELRAWWAQRT